MLKLLSLLLFAGSINAINLKSESFVFSHYVPQYMEANQTFPLAKRYILSQLPNSLSNPLIGNYKQLAFAGLAAITGGLAETYTVDPSYYDPDDILEYYDEYGRNHYAQVVRITNELLEDASRKIQPIINLINAICTSEPYLGCNEAVDAKVRANPYVYYMPARLFIHLGKISKNIMKNQVLLDKIINNDEVLNYLSVHGYDRGIMKLVKRFSKTYVIFKRMGALEEEFE